MNNNNFINKFWDFNRENHLGSNAIAMYFLLMKNAKQNVFPLSDTVVSNELSISRKTVKQVRDKLELANLIKVFNKKGEITRYQILDIEGHGDSEKKNLKKKNLEKIPRKIIKKEINNLVIEENSINIPSISEFMSFAKTLTKYNASMDGALELKYKEWKKSGWKNSQGRDITDYKGALKSVLPFLELQSEEEIFVPKIKIPK